jgi:hypothetical protein
MLNAEPLPLNSDGKVADRNAEQGLARRDREWPLNEARIPDFRGVRLALGTGVLSCRGKETGGRRETAP